MNLNEKVDALNKKVDALIEFVVLLAELIDGLDWPQTRHFLAELQEIKQKYN